MAICIDASFSRKKRNQLLRRKYGITMPVEQRCFDRLMELLRRIDCGAALSDTEKSWFRSEGKTYFTSAVAARCKEQEIGSLVAAYQRSGDPALALAASRHLRQCERQAEAYELLSSVPVERLRLSTAGPEFRVELGMILSDLGLLSEALQIAEEIHALVPAESAPCALAGTVNLELGRYATATEWLTKALQRGVAEHLVDRELRLVLKRADQHRRGDIRTALLRCDSARFQWVDAFVAA